MPPTFRPSRLLRTWLHVDRPGDNQRSFFPAALEHAECFDIGQENGPCQRPFLGIVHIRVCAADPTGNIPGPMKNCEYGGENPITGAIKCSKRQWRG